eukprot:TRINITY_DN34078_c0_g1_i1.p2 TRINITY_DN34078_c0_g1~~TRINITY_DN34078_c0_g1_i1.p2  ORF type:complete len:50 (+),score=1.25 TRINITY_DN34078_c0_g1_i1:26-175(+)
MGSNNLQISVKFNNLCSDKRKTIQINDSIRNDDMVITEGDESKGSICIR